MTEGDKFFVTHKAVIRDGDNILCMLRSELNKNHPLKWDLPGGKLDAGENLQEGLRREVMEETGLEIEPEKMVFSFFDGRDNKNYIFVIWQCTAKSKGVKLSLEHKEYKWLSKDELLALPHMPFFEAFFQELQ